MSWTLPAGGSVRVFGIAAGRGRYERQVVRHQSVWLRDYLRKAVFVDLVCAVLAVFLAAQIRFGNDVDGTYLSLSLALPVMWIGAVWFLHARYSISKRLHRQRVSGQCLLNVVAVGHELAVANLHVNHQLTDDTSRHR